MYLEGLVEEFTGESTQDTRPPPPSPAAPALTPRDVDDLDQLRNSGFTVQAVYV